MNQLREFAQRSDEFEKLGVELVALSVDDQEHASKVWGEVVHHKFRILSDPGASVIRKYGLLHKQGGHDGEDIAIRTTFLIDPTGKVQWRRVSASVPDIPAAEEALQKIKAAQSAAE